MSSYPRVPLIQLLHTLDSSRHSSGLDPLNVLSGQLSRQEWILRERLEIPTTQGVAVHANRWGEKYIRRPRLHLGSQMLTNLIKQVLVPGRSERDAAGEQGCFRASDENTTASSIGPVASLDCGNPFRGDRLGSPEIRGGK